MKNKTKKPMVNSESSSIKLSTTLKVGSWSTKEDTILLGCPSNIMAGIILGRPYKACGSHRYLLVKDGRRSVKMERMGQGKAKELAYKYLTKIKKEADEASGISQLQLPTTTDVTFPLKDDASSTPIMVEEIGGLVIVLNEQEMVMKTSPRRLIIKGEKLNITIE